MGADRPYLGDTRTLALSRTRALEPVAILFDETQGLAFRTARGNRRDRHAITAQGEPIAVSSMTALKDDFRRRLVYPSLGGKCAEQILLRFAIHASRETET